MNNTETGIYQILNNINGKFYIGSTARSFKIRWKRHITDLNSQNHCNIHLQRAWIKYGKQNFSFKILKVCEPVDCIKYEQEYIDNLEPEYNLCKKAGSTLGLKATEVTKKKQSLARKGKKMRPEVLAARINNKISAGENNSQSKLTEADVIKIRELYQSKKFRYKDLAAMFKVTTGAIGSIIRNKTWKNEIDFNKKDRSRNNFKEGSFNGRAKLTQEDVNEIRRLWDNKQRTKKELANLYNVSLSNIVCILNNKSWIDKN